MPASNANPNMLVVETDLYKQRMEEFVQEHNMEWVVIHKKEIVGFYQDFQEAAANAIQRFGRGPYLIKQIGAPEASIRPSVFTRPMYV